MIDPNAAVEVFEEVDSTNSQAQRRAAAGDFGPVWLRAASQTAGRGRRGRDWVSVAGNLYCTYLGASSGGLTRLAQLGFAAALALAQTIEGLAPGARVGLKWPNDVLIGGAKVAGVLLESGAIGDGRHWFALGIGLNLAHAPGDTPYPATHLGASGAIITPDAALDALRPRLARWAQTLESAGFEPLRTAWLARGPAAGAVLSARSGDSHVTGAFAGLTETGALLLRLEGGVVRAMSAGEILQGSTPC